MQATISEISTKLRTAPSERYSKLIKFSMPFKDFIFERVILKLFKLVNVLITDKSFSSKSEMYKCSKLVTFSCSILIIFFLVQIFIFNEYSDLGSLEQSKIKSESRYNEITRPSKFSKS